MLRLIAIATLGLFVLNAEVQADKGKGKGGNNAAKTAQAKIEGTISAVGPASVTIVSRSGVSKTLTVSASTKVERNDRHVALSAFKVGDRGEALFNATTLLASKVEATGK
jgi:hypothetical protein